jgi:NAD(P)-dependent dehydrogenase (short-subunit alcohol dehydrogenase family)
VADFALDGRVAVVTGAGTGIGAAIARELAAAGADLLLHYRSHAASLDAVAADCRSAGRRVEVAQADFAADPWAAATVVDAAAERLGRLDILVNNAAVTTRLEPLETMARGLWEETMGVNVAAPFAAIQAAAQHMIRGGHGGRVVNIGSVHGRQAAPQHVAYETSKGAIAALTFSAAVTLGQYGITVNCVAPGVIVVERYAEADWDEAWYVSRTPVARNGVPADIARTVRFLCSDEASFITGETIYVDGGMTRRMPLVK